MLREQQRFNSAGEKQTVIWKCFLLLIFQIKKRGSVTVPKMRQYSEVTGCLNCIVGSIYKIVINYPKLFLCVKWSGNPRVRDSAHLKFCCVLGHKHVL